jgi:hypothetical protein
MTVGSKVGSDGRRRGGLAGLVRVARSEIEDEGRRRRGRYEGRTKEGTGRKSAPVSFWRRIERRWTKTILGKPITTNGMESAFSMGKEVIGMEYLVIAVPAAGVLFVGRHLYLRLERWNRSRRLRGAQACLNAVHDTLVTLAESNPKVRSGRSS